jgi:hypothetical protein
MIPYIFATIIAGFSAKRFWRNWAITSGLLIIYSMTVGVYVACQTSNIPFQDYVANIGSNGFWMGLAEVALRCSVLVFGIFLVTHFWRQIRRRIAKN